MEVAADRSFRMGLGLMLRNSGQADRSRYMDAAMVFIMASCARVETRRPPQTVKN